VNFNKGNLWIVKKYDEKWNQKNKVSFCANAAIFKPTVHS
jgi:hypothetical protein